MTNILYIFDLGNFDLEVQDCRLHFIVLLDFLVELGVTINYFDFLFTRPIVGLPIYKSITYNYL